MKPIILEFCGINSFSEPTKIDFESLTEYGIFGIFGDTGSGKSTILDCICLALYGEIRRARKLSEAVNYRCDKAWVKFTFEIVYDGKRRRYLAEREIGRKAGSNSARLSEEENGAWVALADRIDQTDAALKRIIGLERQDFERCIALPQGEFAQFIKAAPAERLKLVSRLFGLERFGEALNESLRRRTGEAEFARKSLEVRMEQYAEVSEEGIEALAAELKAEETERETIRAALHTAKERAEMLARAFERGEELKKTLARLSVLESRKEEFSRLETELSRLERAEAVAAAWRDGVRLREESDDKRAKEAALKARLDEAERALNALASYNEEEAAEEIERLAVLARQAETAEGLRRKGERARAGLAKEREKLAAEQQKFVGFSYETRRDELQRQLTLLGQEDFFAYAETHGKAALLRGEYAVFASEVEELTVKHPEIEGDSLPLSRKYRELSEGETAEFSQIRQKFGEVEAQREQTRKLLMRLEAERSAYTVHLGELERSQAEIRRLEEEAAECEKELEGLPASLPEAQKQLEEKKAERAKHLGERTRATDFLSAVRTEYAALKAGAEAAERALQEGRKRFSDALAAGGFQGREEAETLLVKYGDPEEAHGRLERYKNEFAALTAKKEEFSDADTAISAEEVVRAKEECKAAETRLAELEKRAAVHTNELARFKSMLESKKELSKELDAALAKEALWNRLSKLLSRGKFMEFAAEEYLQTVAVNAGERLLALTGGRYFLRYDGGFSVGDNFNGGQLRSVGTLSGGETFLVSLSLALALSAEICARSMRPIEFFFLDEGFGTLDARLVDVVMDSLETLRSEQFCVGLISHVEELKQRIYRKLLVVGATESSGSKIVTE